MNKNNSKFRNRLKWFRKAAGSVLMIIALLAVSLLSPASVSMAAQKNNTAKDYQSVEKAYFGKLIDNFTDSYATYAENYKKLASGLATQGTVKVEVNSDLAAALGLKNFRSVQADVESKLTDKKADSKITYFVNDFKIITLDVLQDLENDIMYMVIPELSKAYLKISANSLGNTKLFTTKNVIDFFTSDKISASQLNRLLKKYANIAISQIKDVSAMDYYTSAGNIGDNQTMYTVKIDKKQYLAMAENVLKTARLDEDLKNLLVSLNVCTKEQFVQKIDTALKSVAQQKKAAASKNENLLTMEVWVDSQGNVTGREFAFNFNSNTITIGYKALSNGSNTGIDIWFSPDKGHTFQLNGTIKEENGCCNGDLTLTYADLTQKTEQKFDVLLSDITTVTKDNVNYVKGNIIITSKALPGFKVEVNLSGSETEQLIKAEVVQGTSKLATVTVNSKVVPFKDFSLPSESDQIYDFKTQYNEYVKGLDVEGFIADINSKINLDEINSLLENAAISYK